MLRYFVSYHNKDGSMGNLDISSKYPITTIEQIREIEKEVDRLHREKGYRYLNPVVTNYILLKDERESS